MAEQVRRAEIAALRAQKLPAFLPSKAHIVFGHGEEVPTDSFVLPPTCMVIAIAYPGEVMWYSTILPMIQKLGCVNPEFLRNPLENPEVMREIVNLTGGVVVYKPGERCPNFQYLLLQFYQTSRLSKLNGIVELDEHSCERFKLLGLEDEKTIPYESYESSEGKEFLYEHSAYPTPELFAQQVAEKKAELGDAPYMNQITKSNPALSCLAIDQKRLCAMFPGVTYNFVCRFVPEKSVSLFGSGVPRKGSLYNYSTLREAVPNIQLLLKQRIANAERRKKLMPGAYLNQEGSDPTKLLWHGIQFLSPRNIRTALDSGADLESKENEFTPLEAIVIRDIHNEKEEAALLEITLLLLSAGAAISEKVVKDSLRYPLVVKTPDGSNRFPVVEALGERGVFAEPGQTFIRINYIQNYKKGLFQTLVRYGFNLLETDTLGNTYLMLFLGKLGSPGIQFTKDLFNSMPHLHTQNKVGNTVLHLALSINRIELAAFSLQKEPELINIPNNEGNTPLMDAMIYYERDMVKNNSIKLLLFHTPSPNVLGSFKDPDEPLANYFGKYRNKLGSEITDKFKELWLAQGGDAAVLEEMMTQPPVVSGGRRQRKKLKTRRRRGGKSPSRSQTRRR